MEESLTDKQVVARFLLQLPDLKIPRKGSNQNPEGRHAVWYEVMWEKYIIWAKENDIKNFKFSEKGDLTDREWKNLCIKERKPFCSIIKNDLHIHECKPRIGIANKQKRGIMEKWGELFPKLEKWSKNEDIVQKKSSQQSLLDSMLARSNNSSLDTNIQNNNNNNNNTEQEDSSVDESNSEDESNSPTTNAIKKTKKRFNNEQRSVIFSLLYNVYPEVEDTNKNTHLKCTICDTIKIRRGYFIAGHIIAEKYGNNELYNVWPTCGDCNNSMGVKNMFDYVMEKNEDKVYPMAKSLFINWGQSDNKNEMLRFIKDKFGKNQPGMIQNKNVFRKIREGIAIDNTKKNEMLCRNKEDEIATEKLKIKTIEKEIEEYESEIRKIKSKIEEKESFKINLNNIIDQMKRDKDALREKKYQQDSELVALCDHVIEEFEKQN